MTLASASLLQQLRLTAIPAYPVLTGLHRPITLRSLGWFFYALSWAWALLVSCTGWGRLAAKLARVRPLPASVACATGIAVLIFLGGLLNLVHAIYATVLFAMVAIGLVLYFLLRRARPQKFEWNRFWEQTPSAARLLLIAALLLLVFRVAATVRMGVVNNLDDGPGYLTFPHKMLQVHDFAPDPFSERRVANSLGGGYFLQSFVAAAASLSNIGMADRALGLILLGGVLFDLAILFELSAMQIAWLELLAYIVPQQAMNLTFIVLPVVLLLGMVWLMWRSLDEESPHPAACALLAGALGGAAISLKSTYLPCVGAFALLPPLFLLGKKRSAWKLPLLAGLGALAVLAAWMIAMKTTSGTWLFPVLGHGIDYSSYGLFPAARKFPTTRRLIKVFLQGGALIVLAATQFAAMKRAKASGDASMDNVARRVWFSAAILIAAAAAITAVNYASGGDSVWRYNFPQFFCAVLVYFIVAASIRRMRPASSDARVVYVLAAICLFAMLFYYDAAGKRPQPFREVGMAWRDYVPSIRASLSGRRLENPQVRAEYRAVENSLAPHTLALENTAFPFLFNFRLHKIWIADWPAAASPAPGWPLRSDTAALAPYLRNHSVRYVIYDYGYGRWMDAEGCKALESHDLNSEWLLEQWRLSIVSHSQFDRLADRYRSVYNDGRIVVIDLAHPATAAVTPPPSWTLDTNKDAMCSAVMAAYLAQPPPAK